MRSRPCREIESRAIETHLRRSYGRKLVEAPAILEGGEDNLNVRVVTDGGDFVLRRYDVCGRTRALQELQLVNAIACKDFPTPCPVRTNSGILIARYQRRPAALFPFMSGTIPQRYTPALAEQMGVLLARLHLTTMRLRLPLRRASELRDLESALTLQRALKFSGAKLWLDTVAEFIDRHGRWVRRAERTLPRAIIHHDFHRSNLLCNQRGNVVAVLDFGEACAGTFVLDIARTLSYMAVDSANFRVPAALQNKLLNGYESHRPLSTEERGAIPLTFALANLADAARFLSTAHRSIKSLNECRSWRVFEAS